MSLNLRRKQLRGPFWNDPDVVGNTPFATTFLLEGANVQQLWTMWTKWTAAGQSLTGWMSVGLALLFWTNYYRVISPEQNRKAFCVTLGGCVMNALVILTVLFFRMIGRG